MSRSRILHRAWLPLATLGILAVAAVASAAAPPAAQLERYAHPDGSEYFALSLRPTVAPAAGPRDVVLLFDTSAGQTGEYRTKALQVARAVAASLGKNDRVQLMAVDVKPAALTTGFVAADSPEMAAAWQKLERRVPLGATDLDAGLTAAAAAFDASTAQHAVVYIGKGTSRANIITPERFDELTKQLTAKRVPINSYAIGPQPDRQLLGALAAQTGGNVVNETSGVEAAAEAQSVIAAVHGTVLWPTEFTPPQSMKQVYPARTPPLRTDRETVLIGTMTGGDAAVELGMTVQAPGGPEKLSWTVTPAAADAKNAYLAQLVGVASKDGGLTLPVTDAKSLLLARAEQRLGVSDAVQTARQALARGDLDGADRIADQAIAADPNDQAAKDIKTEVAKRRTAGGAAPGEIVPLQAGPAAPAAGAGASDLTLVGPGAAPVLPPSSGFSENYIKEASITEQIIRTQVQKTVNDARANMARSPQEAARAIQDLKLQQETLRHSDIRPEVRNQLDDVIQTTLRVAEQRVTQLDIIRQQNDERLAKAREMKLIADNLNRKERKLTELMARFDSLMNEGRYRLAEESAAMEAQALAPNEPAVVAATLTARATGAYSEMMQLRVARQRGVLETLLQVEKSHVPFPDEPPLVYPAADVWRDLTARRKEKYSSMDLKQRNPAEKRIEEALRSPTQMPDFIETPLRDVIDYLKDYHKIEIQMDKKALDEVAISTDTPITKNLRGISLKSALRLTLRELGLTYIIKDEVLLITTPEEADAQLVTKVYPVADLVLPIRELSMGGMMGGMSGGMMGGGMGGRGGGMGGGFFNVPQGVLPRVPQGGFQAFAVNDDLTVTAKSETPAPATVNAAMTKPAKVEKIEIELPAGADPQEVWSKYFAAHEPDSAAVRETVRQLMQGKKYDHVIAVINAALTNKQVQPWMYEALVLAMQAADRPQDEIERVVLSAVDLAQSPLDLMVIAGYFSELGLDARALQIFQNVAKLAPNQPEPYVLGLRVAKRLNDVKGIQWASVGILSQAYPAEQAEIFKAGLFAAKATLDKLRSEKKLQEAAAFEKTLNEAIRRDVVVKATWTGEADIDIVVEDPSGSVCSLRAPRSRGGGVMLGDSSAQLGSNVAEGRSEVFVCPKGFSGNYRVLVRRVWGRPTAGKVNVEVITHFRDKDVKYVEKAVNLQNDEAVVSFNLDNGRRTEPLAQVAMENAAVAQQAVNRQVLGQQLAAAVDPRALAGFGDSRGTFTSSANGNTGNGATPFAFPFFNQGAVGYQPVIIWIPEGASLTAQAVISADRRYVRITCVPFFSAITEVNVFNMASGANTQGRGGTGGSGFSDLFGGGNGNNGGNNNQGGGGLGF